MRVEYLNNVRRIVEISMWFSVKKSLLFFIFSWKNLVSALHISFDINYLDRSPLTKKPHDIRSNKFRIWDYYLLIETSIVKFSTQFNYVKP